MTTMQTTIDSPVGPLALTVDDDGALTRLGFGAGDVSDDPRFDQVLAQLREYFAGERTDFDLDAASRGRHRLRAARLDRAADDPLRRDRQLRRDRRAASATPARRAPSAAPTAATRSPSSARATASSAATAR